MMTLPPRTAREHLSEAVIAPAFLFLAGTTATIAFNQDEKFSYFALFPLRSATVLLIIFWWAMLLIRSSRAASPSMLQLIPGFRRQTVTNTLLAWLALSLALTAILIGPLETLLLVWLIAIGNMFRRPEVRRALVIVGSLLWLFYCFFSFAAEWSPLGKSEIPFEFVRSALGWGGAVCALGVVGIQCLYRYLGTIICAIYLIAAAPNMLPGPSFWTELYSPGAVTNPDYALILIAMGILMFGMIVHRLVNRRGDRGMERYRSDSDTRLAITTAIDSDKQANWSRMKTPSAKAAAHFEQYIAAQRDVRKLVAFAFGPSLHGLREIKLHLLAAGGMILMAQILQLSKHYQPSLAGNMFLLFPFVTMIGPVVLPLLIRRSRRELALLATTPNWLASHTLNRWLVKYLAQRTIISWVFAMLSLLALAGLHSLPTDLVIRTAITATLFATFLFGNTLQDYTHATTNGGRSMNVLLAILVVPSTIALLVFIPESPVMTTMAIGVVIACFVTWRLVRMLNGPATLPVGRLAKSAA